MSEKIIRFTAVMYEHEMKRLDQIDRRNRAAATRNAVDRYFFIVENARPAILAKFSEAELKALSRVFQFFDFFVHDLQLIPDHLHEILRAQLLARGAARSLDVDDMAERMKSLPVDEKFALIHEAQVRLVKWLRQGAAA